MELEDYLKSLNPQKEEQTILVYNSEYHLWYEGEYLGVAKWTKDKNVGDSFQTDGIHEKTGHKVHEIYRADKWELVVNKDEK